MITEAGYEKMREQGRQALAALDEAIAGLQRKREGLVRVLDGLDLVLGPPEPRGNGAPERSHPPRRTVPHPQQNEG